MFGLQKPQLRHDQKQNGDTREACPQEILQALQESNRPQGDGEVKVITSPPLTKIYVAFAT